MANHQRIWEIDFIRGLAIIFMIIFHLIVDLKDFHSYPIDYLTGFWYIEGKLSAILFMLICGVSTTLGTNSRKHGIKIFTWAMVLTIITYLYNENNYIRFGILHFLGISLLSVPIIRKLSIYWLAMISSITITIGNLVSNYYINNPYLFPIGLKSHTFVSMDFYPLFPWYGIFLFGIILGKFFYENSINFPLGEKSHRQSKFLNSFPSSSLIHFITILGQHSLAVYLIHQPILLLALYLFHGK